MAVTRKGQNFALRKNTLKNGAAKLQQKAKAAKEKRLRPLEKGRKLKRQNGSLDECRAKKRRARCRRRGSTCKRRKRRSCSKKRKNKCKRKRRSRCAKRRRKRRCARKRRNRCGKRRKPHCGMQQKARCVRKGMTRRPCSYEKIGQTERGVFNLITELYKKKELKKMSDPEIKDFGIALWNASSIEGKATLMKKNFNPAEVTINVGWGVYGSVIAKRKQKRQYKAYRKYE